MNTVSKIVDSVYLAFYCWKKTLFVCIFSLTFGVSYIRLRYLQNIVPFKVWHFAINLKAYIHNTLYYFHKIEEVGSVNSGNVHIQAAFLRFGFPLSILKCPSSIGYDQSYF